MYLKYAWRFACFWTNTLSFLPISAAFKVLQQIAASKAAIWIRMLLLSEKRTWFSTAKKIKKYMFLIITCFSFCTAPLEFVFVSTHRPARRVQCFHMPLWRQEIRNMSISSILKKLTGSRCSITLNVWDCTTVHDKLYVLVRYARIVTVGWNSEVSSKSSSSTHAFDGIKQLPSCNTVLEADIK